MILSNFNMDADADVGKQTADLLSFVTGVSPDVLLIQAANEVNLRTVLPGTYATNQILTDEDSRGVAVAWKAATFTNTDLFVPSNSEPGDVQLNNKYLSKATLKNNSSSRITRVVSVDFPEDPQLQGLAASAILMLFAAGGTTNFAVGGMLRFDIASDPYLIKQRTGMTSRYDAVTGFYLTSTLSASAIDVDSRTDSDEYPLNLTVTL